MLMGIISCFLAVLCIGIDGRFVTPWQFLIVCQARAWTMSVGFTLAFGAMFSKVWRVHRLSTKAKADQGKVSCKLTTDNRVSAGKAVRMIFIMLSSCMKQLCVFFIIPSPGETLLRR